MRLICFIVLCNFVFCQDSISGYIKSTDYRIVQDALIYLQYNDRLFTRSDSVGYFKLILEHSNPSDTLLFFAIGYEEKKIAIHHLKKEDDYFLEPEGQISLGEVEILVGKSISEEFSSTTLNQFDIYLDPLSQGDPLNALQSIPSSTNVTESATPNLRGSLLNKTQVYVNNIPVYIPTKGQQINNVTSASSISNFFVEKMDVYASNAPLFYGNNNGDVIDITTTTKAKDLQNIFISLIGGGGGFSRNLFNDDFSFIQFNTNYMSLLPLKSMHEKSLSVNKYDNFDMSLLSKVKLNNALNLSVFSTFFKESGDYPSNQYLFKDDFKTKSDAYLNLFNLVYKKSPYTNFDLNLGYSTLQNAIKYGALNEQKQNIYLYQSVNYRSNIKGVSFQIGQSFENFRLNNHGNYPLDLYDYSSDTPSIQLQQKQVTKLMEAFIFLKKKINNLQLSIASRIGTTNFSKNYISYQLNSKYFSENNKHTYLFSLGQYNSLGQFIPSYFQDEHRNQSFQYTMEYNYLTPKLKISSALYSKKESGNLFIPHLSNDYLTHLILGSEVSLNLIINKYISALLANTTLISNLKKENEKIDNNSIPYFLKLFLTYNNPKFFSMSISSLYRRGSPYIPVENHVMNYSLENKMIHLPTIINSSFYNKYHIVNLNLSKTIKFKKQSMVVFTAVNNFFDRKNQKNFYYNHSYDPKNIQFEFFGRRLLFIGSTIHF